MEEMWGGMDEGGGKSSCRGRDVREHERNMAQRKIKRECINGKQNPTDKAHGKSNRNKCEAGRVRSVRRMY